MWEGGSGYPLWVRPKAGKNICWVLFLGEFFLIPIFLGPPAHPPPLGGYPDPPCVDPGRIPPGSSKEAWSKLATAPSVGDLMLAAGRRILKALPADFRKRRYDNPVETFHVTVYRPWISKRQGSDVYWVKIQVLGQGIS